MTNEKFYCIKKNLKWKQIKRKKEKMAQKAIAIVQTLLSFQFTLYSFTIVARFMHKLFSVR